MKKGHPLSRILIIQLFTVAILGLTFFRNFWNVEIFFYDLWTKLRVNPAIEDPLVIITLDEESDLFLGEHFPYSYIGHLKLLKKILPQKPTTVSYIMDLYRGTSDGEDRRTVEEIKEVVSQFRKDGGHFRLSSSIDEWGEVTPPDGLKSLGYSLATINIDGSEYARDFAARRIVLGVSGKDSLYTWIANIWGRDTKGLREHFYYAPANASVGNFHYLVNPLTYKFKEIPFYKVLSGQYSKNFFKNKIVLIMPKYFQDLSMGVLTPFSKETKVHEAYIHATMVLSLINTSPISECSSIITKIVSVFFLLLTFGLMRKLRPPKIPYMILVEILGVFIASYLAFHLFGVWFHIFHLLFSIVLSYFFCYPVVALEEYKKRYKVEKEARLRENVEHLKQNFISLISHDLKTPVAQMISSVDCLKSLLREDNETQYYLEGIEQAALDLNKQISSILDLAKIEGDGPQIHKLPIDLNTLLEKIVEDYRSDFEKKKGVIKLDAGVLYSISVDKELITRIFSNIIENTLKYGGENPSLVIATRDIGEWVQISMKDDGPGIDPRNLSNIFEKFFRVKNEKIHNIKGSGLGLYLVKYFVELHEGSITCMSELHQGTEFIIKLPNR